MTLTLNFKRLTFWSRVRIAWDVLRGASATVNGDIESNRG